ncbi:MAG: hypothetical protein JWP54_1712 [Cryobacterium sp.]|jgi:hypothetical protein|nr:hypothetical protein [Cryobacterium sp.]
MTRIRWCDAKPAAGTYADWPGTAHPIMSNLTLELDSWILAPDGPVPSPLLAEIRAEMGGRWVQMWTHN